jgi:hypothetical protein
LIPMLFSLDKISSSLILSVRVVILIFAILEPPLPLCVPARLALDQAEEPLCRPVPPVPWRRPFLPRRSGEKTRSAKPDLSACGEIAGFVPGLAGHPDARCSFRSGRPAT